MSTPAMPGTIDGNSSVCRSTNHFKADHDGESIIMSIEAGKFFTFDAIGFQIWDGIASPIRVDELVGELAERHHESPDRVRSDVMAFLDRLAREGLLDNA